MAIRRACAAADRMRRIGVLLPATPDDSEYPTLVKAFVGQLSQLGWTEGRNMRIDIRWAGGDVDSNRRYAEELVSLAPDVIMASGNSSAGPLLQTIPDDTCGVHDRSRRGRCRSC
jgi:hypothetical protein